jgi:arylsulfatase A-like enzyme
VGDIEKWQHAANMHYRGQKADIWEGGHRVPFIARWPGKIQAGSQSRETICLTDLMATTAAVTGATIPDDAGEDSFNLLPALLGEQRDQPIRDATVHHSMNGTFAIRSGDWKLIAENLGSGGFTAPRVVKPEAAGPAGQLYNLVDDPSEATNVWNDHAEVVARLSERLTKLQTAGRSR